MQVLTERTPILTALSQIGNVAAARSTIPILSNVLLQAENGGLRLTGTDLDIETSSLIEAVVSIPGAITVPARPLADIVRRTELGAQISLTYDAAADARLKVRAGRSNYSLPVLPAGDFPTMIEGEGGVAFEVLPSNLARLIDKAKHAISSDEKTQYVISGGYFHYVEEDGAAWLRMVATDRHRMARVDTPAPEGAETMPGVIIARKALEVARAMLDTGVTAQLIVSKAKFILKCGTSTLISKVIDGEYPAYQRIIPTDSGTTIARLTGATMVKGIERAGIMAEEKSRSIRCTFAEDGLILSARNETGGNAEVPIELEMEGDDVEASFNARLLQDVSSLCGEAVLAFHLFGGAAPMRIDPADDPNLTFIICPQRAS